MTDANADFAARRSAPGVFRGFDFDDASSLGKTSPTGADVNWLNAACCTIASPTGDMPQLDPDVKASGRSALRFDLKSQRGGNAAGQWGMRFSDDNQLQMRAGQSVFIQWRQRFNYAFLNTFFYSGGGGGASGNGFFDTAAAANYVYHGAQWVNDTTFKVPGNPIDVADGKAVFRNGRYMRAWSSLNLTAPWYSYAYARVVSSSYDAASNFTYVIVSIRNGGDPGAQIPLHPALDTVQAPPGNGAQGGFKYIDVTRGARGTDDPGTSPNVKLVMQSYFQQRFPQLYQSNANQGLQANQGGFKSWQNAMPAPFCRNDYTPTDLDSVVHPGCWMPHPDTFHTFQLGIELFDLVVNASGTNASWNWRCRLWAQYEDEPAALLIDWRDTVSGYFRLNADNPTMNYGLGKSNAFPYMTNKDPKQSHGLCQTWFDEWICSTQRIPDHGATKIVVTPSPPVEADPSPTQGDTVPTQADLDDALSKCVAAHDAVAAIAGGKSITQQVSDATDAGKAAQLAVDQPLIDAANTARDQALAAQTKAEQDLANLNSDIDAAQAKDK